MDFKNSKVKLKDNLVVCKQCHCLTHNLFYSKSGCGITFDESGWKEGCSYDLLPEGDRESIQTIISYRRYNNP